MSRRLRSSFHLGVIGSQRLTRQIPLLTCISLKHLPALLQHLLLDSYLSFFLGCRKNILIGLSTLLHRGSHLAAFKQIYLTLSIEGTDMMRLAVLVH